MEKTEKLKQFTELSSELGISTCIIELLKRMEIENYQFKETIKQLQEENNKLKNAK